MKSRSIIIASATLAAAIGACDSNERGAAPEEPADGLEISRPDISPFIEEPYSVEVFDAVRISSDADSPNHHGARQAVDFGDGPFAQVTLVVDLATTCFPFESWADNPPPPGQNWPADCDAFDRNFEISLDPPADPETGVPAIELVRAITPFGGPLHLEVDVTDAANGLGGEHEMAVHIPTYSDADGIVSGSAGGWNVTARLDFLPGAAPRAVVAVIPLFDGVQSDAVGPGPIAFGVPEGTLSGRIEYRVTGHGGGDIGADCIGPADEFCRREHQISIDGLAVETIEPWRTNCEELCTVTHYGPVDGGFDYCAENPCGAIGSVRASRANWCPGSITPPFVWSTPALASPGEHHFEWQISEVGSGGSWRVSAVYFGFGSP